MIDPEDWGRASTPRTAVEGGIHYEVLVDDPDLGVIVRATNLETGASGTGASGGWR